MGNIFLFSLIIGLASALLLLPFSSGTKEKEKAAKQPHILGMIAAIFVVVISVFLFYYFTNLDRNLTSLWPFFIVVSAVGAIISMGKERIIKAILFLGSVVIGV